MSASTNTSNSRKSSSKPSSNAGSKQSKRSEKWSPLISVNLPIISTNFDKQQIRISLSDTEVQVRKPNSAFYGVTAAEETNNEDTPSSSARFHIVHNERTAALQQLILEDFELKSQSTDQETDEDELQEGTEEETVSRDNEYEQQQESNRTSVETQYSPQQEGSSESRPSKTSSSGKSYVRAHRAERDNIHQFPEECLVFSYRDAQNTEAYYHHAHKFPEISPAGDCFILINLAQRTTATIEEIHSSSGRSAESNRSCISPRSHSKFARKTPTETLTPRLCPSAHFGRSARIHSSNRIFPILEQTESSSNDSSHAGIDMKTYDELEKHIQDIYKTAIERKESGPPSRKSAWDEEYRATMHSLSKVKPAVQLDETFLPNSIEEQQHVEAIVSIRNVGSESSKSLQSGHSPIKPPVNIPEIEVIEPSSSKSSLHCKYVSGSVVESQRHYNRKGSPGCSCFEWIREIFCTDKTSKRKQPLRIYKTYFCDVCPECKCATAYF